MQALRPNHFEACEQGISPRSPPHNPAPAMRSGEAAQLTGNGHIWKVAESWVPGIETCATPCPIIVSSNFGRIHPNWVLFEPFETETKGTPPLHSFCTSERWFTIPPTYYPWPFKDYISWKWIRKMRLPREASIKRNTALSPMPGPGTLPIAYGSFSCL